MAKQRRGRKPTGSTPKQNKKHRQTRQRTLDNMLAQEKKRAKEAEDRALLNALLQDPETIDIETATQAPLPSTPTRDNTNRKLAFDRDNEAESEEESEVTQNENIRNEQDKPKSQVQKRTDDTQGYDSDDEIIAEMENTGIDSTTEEDSLEDDNEQEVDDDEGDKEDDEEDDTNYAKNDDGFDQTNNNKANKQETATRPIETKMDESSDDEVKITGVKTGAKGNWKNDESEEDEDAEQWLEIQKKSKKYKQQKQRKVHNDDVINDAGKNKKGHQKETEATKTTRDTPATERLINRHYYKLPGNIQRTYVRRYDVKFWVPPSTEPNIKMAEIARAWMKKIKESDSSAMLVPYLQATKLWYCINPDSIPNSVGKFKELFNGANPKVSGGTIYAKVLVCHNKEYREIMQDISWWFHEVKGGMWERKCQTESTSEVGWLLYSGRQFDLDELKEGMERRFGVNVGLRWREIKRTAGNTGYNPNRNENDIPRGLHIELCTQDMGKAANIIKKTYSATSTDFPLGIKMRLIPIYGSLTNMDVRGKIQHLAARQLAFNSHIFGATTWELSNLDGVDKASGKSLRDCIMQVKSKTIPHLSVFHSVFQSWKKDGSYRFSFIPQLESEAQTTIAGLLTILRYHHGEWVEKHFTPSAIERAEETTWDPITQTVISPNDNLVQEVLEGDQEFNLQDTGEFSFELPSTLRTPRVGGVAAFANETDSVSTMKTRKSALKSSSGGNKKRKSSQANNNDNIISGEEQEQGSTHTRTDPQLPPKHSGDSTGSTSSFSQISSIRTEMSARMNGLESRLGSIFTILQGMQQAVPITTLDPSATRQENAGRPNRDEQPGERRNSNAGSFHEAAGEG